MTNTWTINNKNLIPENVVTSKQYRFIAQLTEIYWREILAKADNNVYAAKSLLIRVSPSSNKFPIIPGKRWIEKRNTKNYIASFKQAK